MNIMKLNAAIIFIAILAAFSCKPVQASQSKSGHQEAITDIQPELSTPELLAAQRQNDQDLHNFIQELKLHDDEL